MRRYSNPGRRAFFSGVCAAALAMTARPATAITPRAAPTPRDPLIEGLIAKMTLEEKAGQLSIFSNPTPTPGSLINPSTHQISLEDLKAQIVRGELTGLFNSIGAAFAHDLQRAAVEHSAHKIPLIFAADIVHGLRTVFPIGLGEAASFDPDLGRRTARATAIESTALGVHWTFAPVVDVARDQRWGRVAEGAGEDTYLGMQMARARVQGFQGADIKAPDSLLACPKHFAAYGAVQGGMEYNTADISDTTLREVHLPPFKAAFDAGALTTMSSFNDIGGVPATGNHYLLTEILRGEWGFRGLVVSDFNSEEELIAHGYAADGPDAVIKALSAGCDISMASGLYNKHIPDLVRSGRLSQALVDTAVRRVLTVKKAIGLFENPYRCLDLAREKTDVRRPEAVALAREAGRKSVVLLKNEGGLLPLAKSASIALIGPSVDRRADMPGPWAVFADVPSHVTFAEGFRAATGPSGRLTVVRGSDFEAPEDGGLDAAVAAARAADVVVMVLGESQRMSGEAQARIEITIPAAQMALAEAVAGTGKPMVVLLRSGRALALTGAVKSAPAIMATWFLGSETGNALADVVFGDFAPQGRLPVSFPQASGQEPFYYNHRSTGRPQVSPTMRRFKAGYREISDQALYPFGHGLSYAAVSYTPTSVDNGELQLNGDLSVWATVTNDGQRAVHEVAQLYIHDRVASITQPVRALKGFQSVELQPGESKRVEFRLTAADLAFAHPDRSNSAELGAFDVWVSPSATGGVPATFTLRSLVE